MGRYSDLLAQPPLRRLMAAGAVVFAGPAGILLVLQWSIVTLAYPPGSTAQAALALAILGVSATVPTIGAAVVSGTLADRHDRRKLMLVTTLASFLAAIGIAIDFAVRPSGRVSWPGSSFYIPVWILVAYPLWAAVTASATIFRPAFNATLPRLVSTAELGTANGLSYGVALGLGVVLTPTIGALFPIGGGVVAVVVVVAMFLGAMGLLLRLRSTEATHRPLPSRKFLSDAFEGYRYLGRNRALLQITISALAINFFSALGFVELSLYVRTILDTSQALLYGAMGAAASLGAAVGTLTAGRLNFERRAGRYLIAFAAGQGLTILALGFITSIWIAIPDLFLFGLFPGLFTTVFLATVQATVPNAVMGRVLAADEVGSYAMVPPGQYAGGLITLSVGVSDTYLAAGSGTVAVAAAMLSFQELRLLGFTPKEPPARRRILTPEPGSPTASGAELIQEA